MKKFLLLLLLSIPVEVSAQPSLWWGNNTITSNINGGIIAKNDTIEMEVKMNPNFSDIRSVYFDFQHQKDAIQLLDVQRGAAIPAAASFSYTNYYYPNCRFNRNGNNTTNNGYNNWMNSNYTCNASTVPYHAINRIMVNVSSAQNLDQATYIKLRFKITNTDAGFPYDSVYMNFAVGYSANGGTLTNTENVGPKGVWIQLSPTANNLIVGDLKHNSNVPSDIRDAFRLSVTDTASQPTEITNASLAGSGAFSFAQQLQTNTPYRLRLMLPSEAVAPLSLAATTVSDYTTAVQEFITQNLDKTFNNQHINKGVKYWAADVNNNNEFDGGDLQILFNAVTGLDTIVTPPVQCGANCYYPISVTEGTTYDNLPIGDWASFNPTFVTKTTTNAEQQVTLKYVLKGDVNLSHSSSVTEQQASALRMGNLVVASGKSVDVSLNNVVVTDNDIVIPFEVDTKNEKLTALQFEVRYDPTKIKFETMFIDTPSWVSFVHPMGNTIRFGALDKDLKNTISGRAVPFKLRFTALQPGVDLRTNVEIVPTMDAADATGAQIGINFNTNVIKLIGANFFKNP